MKYLIDIKSEKQIEIIYNLAAIHTTPGYEYCETNIKGAENICNFSRQKKINTIVFTSSMAPEKMKNLKTHCLYPKALMKVQSWLQKD